MMNTVLKFALVVLVVAAVAAAFLYFRENAVPLAPAEDALPVDQAQAIEEPANIEDILNAPTASSTEAEQEEYTDLVISSAVVTDTVDISSCRPRPAVAQVVDGADIVLVNNDDAERRIGFSEEISFAVPPKSTLTIKAEFGKGPGVYGYGCDLSEGPVGRMYVTE